MKIISYLLILILMLSAKTGSAESTDPICLQQILFQYALSLTPGNGNGVVSISTTSATNNTGHSERIYRISVALSTNDGRSVEITSIKGMVFKNPSTEPENDYQDLNGSRIYDFVPSLTSGHLELSKDLIFEDQLTAAARAWVVYQVEGTSEEGQFFTCYAVLQLSPDEAYVPNDDELINDDSLQDDYIEEDADDGWFYADDVTDESISAAEEAAEAAEDENTADEEE